VVTQSPIVLPTRDFFDLHPFASFEFASRVDALFQKSFLSAQLSVSSCGFIAFFFEGVVFPVEGPHLVYQDITLSPFLFELTSLAAPSFTDERSTAARVQIISLCAVLHLGITPSVQVG